MGKSNGASRTPTTEHTTTAERTPTAERVEAWLKAQRQGRPYTLITVPGLSMALNLSAWTARSHLKKIARFTGYNKVRGDTGRPADIFVYPRNDTAFKRARSYLSKEG